MKWNFGAIDLMWPGQRGDTRGQPFHPNLRLRWFEHMSMVLNMVTRMMFFLLLIAAVSIDAFVFRAWWLIPPAAAVLLNLRVAHSMKFSNKRDYLFALLIAPAEIYMLIRMGHFVRGLAEVLQPPADRQLGGPGQGGARQGRGLDVPVRRPRRRVRRVRRGVELRPDPDGDQVRDPRDRLAHPRDHHHRADRLDALKAMRPYRGFQA